MIKALDMAADGTPLLAVGITPADVALLTDGGCVSLSIRSRSGIEAYVLLTVGPTDAALVERMKTVGAVVVEAVPLVELQDLAAVKL
jgi:hypothetical protein